MRGVTTMSADGRLITRSPRSENHLLLLLPFSPSENCRRAFELRELVLPIPLLIQGQKEGRRQHRDCGERERARHAKRRRIRGELVSKLLWCFPYKTRLLRRFLLSSGALTFSVFDPRKTGAISTTMLQKLQLFQKRLDARYYSLPAIIILATRSVTHTFLMDSFKPRISRVGMKRSRMSETKFFFFFAALQLLGFFFGILFFWLRRRRRGKTRLRL